MPPSFTALPSSFRDPSGFMFGKNEVLYRQVNKVYSDNYRQTIDSGLFQALISEDLLIAHREIKENLSGVKDHFITLQPEPIPFISYPWEWSFGMLKDAALLTLGLVRKAMEKGMILKDATPFNVQFRKGAPIFIDSLSFEKYDETKAWIAYRQFCECFLSPLLISHYTKTPPHSLMLAYPEGIPLSFTSSILPRSTRFSLHTYLHIHLHAKAKAKKENESRGKFTRKKLTDILSSLELLINKCKPPVRETAWSGYYQEAAEREDYLERKLDLVKEWTGALDFDSSLDLGGNTGRFTKLFSDKTSLCIVSDADPSCVDALYREIREQKNSSLHPLIVDLAWPSPSVGLNNRERDSFISRVSGTELVMALALVHHLAIARNIPLAMVAQLFAGIAGRWLLIEFVPKEDEKVKLLLQNREDIFPSYTTGGFESAFEEHFTVEKKEEIGESGRTLYLMKKL